VEKKTIFYRKLGYLDDKEDALKMKEACANEFKTVSNELSKMLTYDEVKK